MRRGQLKFDLAEYPSANGHQAARAGLLLPCPLGDSPQPAIRKEHLDIVSRKILLVLADDASFRVLQDQEQIIHIQRVAHHTHRQTSDEFWFEPELDEVPRLTMGEDLFGLFQRTVFGREA